MKMFKYKAGDTVRVRSQEWMDAQEKDGSGNIFTYNRCIMNSDMQKHAGEVGVIERVSDYGYILKGWHWLWMGWMFDPDFDSSKSNRIMTRWEILAWACSDESRGWVVRYDDNFHDWSPPQYYNYADLPVRYQRARLLSDGSGIDEGTIQGFEVERRL
jgi:hypothetical protein